MGFLDYIHEIRKQGKCAFSIDDAVQALGKSRKAIYSSIEHLVAKQELASPARGFYVIVPPEYQVIGCLPAEFFIPSLMTYWQCDYYACLLTAASYHGASHQAVMVFQVMVNKPRPAITCGRVKVKFIGNKNLAFTPTQKISTRMSMLTASTPEGTAMDLLNYPDQSGGLNHVLTVLAELHENMQVDKLLALIKSSPVLAWQQRLGYMLEMLDAQELANALKENLSKQKRVDYIAFDPDSKVTSMTPRNKTWKIIENTELESDI